MIDGNAPRELINRIELPEGRRVVRVFNKADLPEHPDWACEEGLRVSCLAEDSSEAVSQFIYRAVTDGGGIDTANLVSINARHQHCLKKALEYVRQSHSNLVEGISPEYVAMDLRGALDAIGEIVGKTDVEEILGEIFSSFCIGK